jgi:hypothetical protein
MQASPISWGYPFKHYISLKCAQEQIVFTVTIKKIGEVLSLYNSFQFIVHNAVQLSRLPVQVQSTSL